MNKIFRKCKEFGLMVRLNNISVKDSLNCVKSLKKGNIPLCIVDCKKKNWEELLKEIAFKEDLFIAAENVTSLKEAYSAAGNGAQFFILANSDLSLMKKLKQSGFYFIPRVYSKEDIKICKELGLESVCNSKNTNVCLDLNRLNETDNEIFSIIDLPNKNENYELWINNIAKSFLGLNYSEVIINMDSDRDIIDFGEVFASTNRCKITQGQTNSLILECSDFSRTLSYFKWREMYINPNNTEIVNNKIVKGHFDKSLGGYEIILKERKQ